MCAGTYIRNGQLLGQLQGQEWEAKNAVQNLHCVI